MLIIQSLAFPISSLDSIVYEEMLIEEGVAFSKSDENEVFSYTLLYEDSLSESVGRINSYAMYNDSYNGLFTLHPNTEQMFFLMGVCNTRNPPIPYRIEQCEGLDMDFVCTEELFGNLQQRLIQYELWKSEYDKSEENLK